MRTVTVLGGMRDHALAENFENLHSMMAILVLLKQVLRQIVFEFFALNFEDFTKYRYDAIFSHVFDFCVPVLKRRNYCCRRGSKLWKSCIHEKHC